MRQDDPVAGPIEGLHLPRRAWTVLERENIASLDQLKAMAAGMERVVPGIGRRTAQTIRAELARITAGERRSHYQVDWFLYDRFGRGD
jgi:DNA-directed RNA polymerase alpha subunit